MSMRTKPAELTGAQKCAVLCMAIGGKEAAKILQQLGPEEVEQEIRDLFLALSPAREPGRDVVDARARQAVSAL